MKKTRLLSIPGLIASAILLAVTASNTASAADAADSDMTAAHIEELTRTYFRYLGEYNFEAMWDMSTPEFEIFENDGTKAMRMDLKAFDERLKGAKEAGAQIRFTPSEFRTTVTPTGAWTFYVERGAIPSNEHRRFYGSTIFKRVGDRWLLDKMVSLPVPEGSPNFPQ